MNILILGRLWPNEDRVLALARLGHRLVYGYVEFSPVLSALEPEVMSVALARHNLPGQVQYLVARHEIQVIYCLLNHYDGSTDVALELLDGGVAVPIVRHYKEHPCIPDPRERRALLETTGQIYINDESLEYFRTAYGVHPWSAHILDADMIAERYMTDEFSPKLRAQDGEPHLLVAGHLSMFRNRHDVRDLCVELAQRRVHVHLYGGYYAPDEQGRPILNHLPTRRAYERLAAALPRVHQHDPIPPPSFTREWSRYDAGLMHLRGDPAQPYADFERMNYPYRYTAYLAAGLALAVEATGRGAMEVLVARHEIGLIWRDYDDLAEQLHDSRTIASLTESAVQQRKRFSFDHQAPRLVEILSRYAG